ncbi:MAG: HEPN domain-containing protein [Devosia sp.]
MIPEAEGATPYGIFSLADAYLYAAKDTLANTRKLTGGPTRLLCYHACELYLKAFLRERGEDIPTLRAYGHDLAAMLASAESKGLNPARKAAVAISEAVDRNDYVRVRYMVVEVETDFTVDQVMALAERIRACVRHALGFEEFGTTVLYAPPA